MMKGCVIPVADDKYTLMYKKNAEMASDVSGSRDSNPWKDLED